MLVFEFKAYGKKEQYHKSDEAIRTGQFIRNKCLRYWMDNRGVGRKELYKYCTQLRAEFGFVKGLYSHACQAAVENAQRAIGFSTTVKTKSRVKRAIRSSRKTVARSSTRLVAGNFHHAGNALTLLIRKVSGC